MDYFVRVVFDEAVELNEALNESVFPGHQLLETVDGRQVFHYDLTRALTIEESNEFAEKLANYMFEQGYDNFDIEINTDAELSENPNNNMAIIKSLVDPAAQQRMAALAARPQRGKSYAGMKDRRLNDLKNAHMFDDPISMVKAALNTGATPEEVVQNLSPKVDLSQAPTKDQIAQQRANDPFLQSGPDLRTNEETYDGDDFYEAYGDLWFNEDEELDEAEYQGRKVKLGKPMRGDVKKFKVYVKNPKGNVVKVNFGDPDMKIKKSNPARRRSFRARHNCDNPGPRTKARYWSCRKW
jgi:hypothetical protein